MRINSDNIQGDEFELNPSKFNKGQEFKLDKEITDVGVISKVEVRQGDDDGNFYSYYFYLYCF